MKPLAWTAAALGLVAIIAGAATLWLLRNGELSIDHTDAAQVARGRALYEQHCASCHGRNLEGQPDWQSRNAQGRLPAAPHDETGHTWHHDDLVLFEVTKYGMTKHAPAGYESDMLAFGGTLSDQDIVAVLAYIKSRWPEDIHRKRRAAGMS
jgi:mono/diheme cytochrome c family protein